MDADQMYREELYAILDEGEPWEPITPRQPDSILWRMSGRALKDLFFSSVEALASSDPRDNESEFRQVELVMRSLENKISRLRTSRLGHKAPGAPRSCLRSRRP